MNLSHLQKWLKIVAISSTSRLSRRIVFWLFASLVAIETIVLIPSVQRREQELLLQIEVVSDAKVIWLSKDIASEGKISDRATLQEGFRYDVAWLIDRS